MTLATFLTDAVFATFDCRVRNLISSGLPHIPVKPLNHIKGARLAALCGWYKT